MRWGISSVECQYSQVEFDGVTVFHAELPTNSMLLPKQAMHRERLSDENFLHQVARALLFGEMSGKALELPSTDEFTAK